MGAACCVASRDRTITNGTSNEVVLQRNIRNSPSWSFRWDNRGRVAGEDTAVSWFSDNFRRSDAMDVKSGSTIEATYASEDGSPSNSSHTLTWQKSPVSETNAERLPLAGPVTIADQAAEESMVSIIEENFPSHAIFGEENGWRCKEDSAEYVWVLDPIDGTKSFITGKPLFGTLIALLRHGKPILGIIDQPILRERWIGVVGRNTTLNGEEISTRDCAKLSQAYLYTTSPHLFNGDAEVAFARVRSKVKVPLYGCDCYAYALLASGFVDLVIESGLKPYDFLSLVPVIEGAGGTITDWRGQQLHWEATSSSRAPSFNVLAAGDKKIHQQAIDSLGWRDFRHVAETIK